MARRERQRDRSGSRARAPSVVSVSSAASEWLGRLDDFSDAERMSDRDGEVAESGLKPSSAGSPRGRRGRDARRDMPSSAGSGESRKRSLSKKNKMARPTDRCAAAAVAPQDLEPRSKQQQRWGSRSSDDDERPSSAAAAAVEPEPPVYKPPTAKAAAAAAAAEPVYKPPTAKAAPVTGRDFLSPSSAGEPFLPSSAGGPAQGPQSSLRDLLRAGPPMPSPDVTMSLAATAAAMADDDDAMSEVPSSAGASFYPATGPWQRARGLRLRPPPPPPPPQPQARPRPQAARAKPTAPRRMSWAEWQAEVEAEQVVSSGLRPCPCGCGVQVRRKSDSVDEALRQPGKLVETMKAVYVLCVDCEPTRDNVCAVAYNWCVRDAGFSKAKKSGKWWRCATHGWSTDD